VDVDFGREYRLTLCVLGGLILHSRPSGHATRQDTEEALSLTKRVCDEIFGSNRPYVQIEDYVFLQGATPSARMAFIQHMRHRRQLVGLVFCNTSPMFRISVKLGKRLVTPDTRVHLVDDFPAAVERAREVLQDHGVPAAVFSTAQPRSEPEGAGSDAKKRWSLRLDGFSIRYEWLEPDEVQATSEGFLEHKHIRPLFEHMKVMFNAMECEPGPFFSINDVTGLQGVGGRARMAYIREFLAFHEIHPVRMYLVFGANRLLRAAYMMGRPFSPFPVRFVGDADGARRLVAEFRSETPGSAVSHPRRSKRPPTAGTEPTQELVEEFLRFLGSIEWETDGRGLAETEAGSADHPFNLLFEAVSLIKSDLDQILNEKEEAVKALGMERAYLGQLFEASQMAMVRQSEGGLIRQVNREFTRVFGYEAEEVIGRAIDDIFVPEEGREEARQIMRRVDQGERVSFETLRRHKDGTLIPVEVLAFPIVLGEQQVGAYGMYRDIRERIAAETALRESEERYRNILDTIDEGYYEVDLAGNFTFVNTSMSSVMGYAGNELIGMNNRDYMDEKTAGKVYATFNRVYRTGRPDKGFDWEIIGKDGSMRTLETSVSLLTGPDGEPIGFRGILRDHTERKQARKEKEQLRIQLQHAQRMEAVGTLAGGIAHNFNNLLMGIQGNASLMAMDLDPEHPHYARLKAIEKMVKGGADLTQQLLGYAREGRYEVHPIDLNELVREMAGTFAIARRELRIHADLFESLRATPADRGQIEQALMNLLVNAADAMPQGGDLYLSTRSVSSRDMKDRPYIPKKGDYALLVVRDTGHGMDEATRAKIFEPFFTTKGLGKGTGLGLASVYGIVKAHGGYIEVASRVGEGTVFELFLPVTEAPAERDAEEPASTDSGRGTILLVDDEPVVLDAGGDMLERLSYTVWKAGGGDEAVRRFERDHGKIDLVILDMIMPEMPGGEVYDRLKRVDPGVRVLLSSGYSINGQASEILERGCDDFIQKPFDLTTLSQKVKGILNRP